MTTRSIGFVGKFFIEILKLPISFDIPYRNTFNAVQIVSLSKIITATVHEASYTDVSAWYFLCYFERETVGFERRKSTLSAGGRF